MSREEQWRILSREEQWRILHDWATSFRVKNNLTAKQFLLLIGLPCEDYYYVYLYPHRQRMDPRTTGIEEELFQGMTRAFNAVQPVDDDLLAADRFGMQRDILRAQGVVDCYFDLDESGKLFAECLIDGKITILPDFVKLIQEAVKFNCDVKVVPTEKSSE